MGCCFIQLSTLLLKASSGLQRWGTASFSSTVWFAACAVKYYIITCVLADPQLLLHFPTRDPILKEHIKNTKKQPQSVCLYLGLLTGPISCDESAEDWSTVKHHCCSADYTARPSICLTPPWPAPPSFQDTQIILSLDICLPPCPPNILHHKAKHFRRLRIPLICSTSAYCYRLFCVYLLCTS